MAHKAAPLVYLLCFVGKCSIALPTGALSGVQCPYHPGSSLKVIGNSTQKTQT